VFLSIAIQAAVAALCPKAINTGSMRIDPCATCKAQRQMGTRRFSHSPLGGMIERYEMP
jgi:hypothetical protein